MAQKVEVLLVDDIDGSAAVETIAFGLDGTQYEIDLNSGHARGLRELAAPYIGKARRITGPGRRPARSRSASVNGVNSEKIREWAKAQGIDVKDRGRVPAGLVAQYEMANSQ
jgi:Lsr2